MSGYQPNPYDQVPPAGAAPQPAQPNWAAPPTGYGSYPPGYPQGQQAGFPGGSGVPQPWGHAPLATWGDRVIASLWDSLLQLPGAILYIAGMIMMAVSTPTRSASGRVLSQGNSGMAALGWILLGVSLVAMIGVGIWNVVLRQGRTGQSWGKSKVGLRVVSQRDGQIQGIGMNFVRQLAHYLDGLAYVGYLFPLWDPMRRTFADMIMSTVVIKER